MAKYRKEIKYLTILTEAEILKSKIKTFCDFEEYKVRSLYFDDLDNTCFFQKEEGFKDREKYRIRYYSTDNTLKLEIKEKNGLTSTKKRTEISKELYKNIIENNLNLEKITDNKILLGFCAKTNTYQPKVIIEYSRESFSYKNNDFKVTIDYDIKKSDLIEEFLNPDLKMQQILNKNQCIIEVKYQDIIPFFFREFFNKIDVKRTAYSKYYYARKVI